MDARSDRIDERLTRIKNRIGDGEVSTVKWMFVFWAGTGAMVLG
jgi:hypothetical protein